MRLLKNIAKVRPNVRPLYFSSNACSFNSLTRRMAKITPRAIQNFHVARTSFDGHVNSAVHLLVFQFQPRNPRVGKGVNDRGHVKTGNGEL